MIETNLPSTEFCPDRIAGSKPLYEFKGKGTGRAKLLRDGSRSSFVALVKAGELAGFNQLSCRIWNRTAIPVRLEMVLSGRSEKGMREGLRLFSGGREGLAPGEERIVRFPAESFGFYGRERAWVNVSRIEIVGKKEKTDTGREPVDVVVSHLCGECRGVPPGPRLTEEGLALRLHGDFTGPIFSASATDPLETNLLQPHYYPQESADEILAGEIMGQRLPNPIPWDFSPDGAHEWTHFLNRFHFLRPALRAFIETKKHKYLIFIEEIICDWIRKNPVPLGSNGGAGPAWETLSVAWRLREWLAVNKALWNSYPGRAETRRLILRSIWEHCRHLMDHQGHPNNWIILESGALALTGMNIPAFKESGLWRREGISRLTREIGRQFMADGVHYECSPLYHALCLEMLLEVRETAGKCGIKLPGKFHAPLEKAADYLGALCRPDFTWPSLNDSGGAAGDYAAVMERAGKSFGREDFIWLGTRGRRGKPPSNKIHRFRSAGIAVMRSGWEKTSHSLLFRAGPPGMSHVHADVLSLDISVAGVPCLVDPGITAYAPGPRSLWYRSAAAHNMILIDGEGPVRSGLPYQSRIQPAGKSIFFSAAGGRPHVGGVCGNYRENGTGPAVSVTREAALLDDGGIITDLIAGEGDCRVTVCWQFFPGRVRYDGETYTVFYTDVAGRGCTLALSAGGRRPEVVHFRGRLRPVAGWVSIQGQDIPADHFQFSFSTTLPLGLTWEIRPYAGRSQASP